MIGIVLSDDKNNIYKDNRKKHKNDNSITGKDITKNRNDSNNSNITNGHGINDRNKDDNNNNN